MTLGGRSITTAVYVKMDAAEELLLSEDVCRQMEIVKYHPDVADFSTWLEYPLLLLKYSVKPCRTFKPRSSLYIDDILIFSKDIDQHCAPFGTSISEAKKLGSN